VHEVPPRLVVDFYASAGIMPAPRPTEYTEREWSVIVGRAFGAIDEHMGHGPGSERSRHRFESADGDWDKPHCVPEEYEWGALYTVGSRGRWYPIHTNGLKLTMRRVEIKRPAAGGCCGQCPKWVAPPSNPVRSDERFTPQDLLDAFSQVAGGTEGSGGFSP